MSEVARKAGPGAIGAYLCDGESHIKYYLIGWTGEPYQAKADEEIMQDGQTFHVCEGEWLCKGTWLYSVPEARNWYFIKQDDIELVVRMQHVIDAYVQMKPVSSENRLLSNAGDVGHRMQLEELLKSLGIDDEVHDFLIDRATEMEDWDR